MAYKVMVTPRSFGKGNSQPIDILRENGCELVLNPYGRILNKQEMAEMIRDADAVIVGVDPIDQEVLEQATKLKVISKYGVGTDNIDLNYARDKGIPVTVTNGANKDAVADYTMTLMLAAARKMIPIDKACRQLNWNKITSVDVWGKTLGLIGLGAIGKSVAARAKGFNMDIIAYDLMKDETYASENQIKYVSLDELLRCADFISLHLPLTDKTLHLIGAQELASMKETAVIVNTARGGLIHEQALLEALKEKRIWGAGLDVFEQEPPQDKGFLELDNLIIGSHCAASTYQAIENMGIMAAANVLEHLKQSSLMEGK
ncbi:phosphoglycerate dehydrogenase [Paenibacillus sp. FJAT-27812]|uniref:phosphoglycerate dehydrogenase n=1 Tax=Paenibacillus sp. FJAT-27812 TaxID=1684143 RepID=UPI0006A75FED|nr:phosphoglycerate dehydrogenase [Paenibacillus sp. FJAT-27812]